MIMVVYYCSSYYYHFIIIHTEGDVFLWTGSREERIQQWTIRAFQVNAETSAILIDNITFEHPARTRWQFWCIIFLSPQFLFSWLQFPCYYLLIKTICWLFIFFKSLGKKQRALSSLSFCLLDRYYPTLGDNYYMQCLLSSYHFYCGL